MPNWMLITVNYIIRKVKSVLWCSFRQCVMKPTIFLSRFYNDNARSTGIRITEVTLIILLDYLGKRRVSSHSMMPATLGLLVWFLHSQDLKLTLLPQPQIDWHRHGRGSESGSTLKDVERPQPSCDRPLLPRSHRRR